MLSALRARYQAIRDERDAALVDALFVADDARGWLTGISELSVSFRGDRPPAVRALAEVIARRGLAPALAAAGLGWGTALLDAAAASAGAAYAAPLFRELYELVYLRDVAAPAPAFRFGAAIEHGGEAPVVKLYFDLHATAPANRPRALARIAERVGETAALEAWLRACPAAEVANSRVIGVDFLAGSAVRTKLYWGARRLTWDAIAAASRQTSGERHVETLARLRREVCAVTDELSSVMVSLCATGGARSMKLDVCVARIYRHDGEAHDAIERFCRPILGDQQGTPFELVSGGVPPRDTRCIQQYLGVELPPDRSARVTIYYRPIGFETEHLNAALRPRRCA